MFILDLTALIHAKVPFNLPSRIKNGQRFTITIRIETPICQIASPLKWTILEIKFLENLNVQNNLIEQIKIKIAVKIEYRPEINYYELQDCSSDCKSVTYYCHWLSLLIQMQFLAILHR